MPEYKAPGVYVEEVERGPKPIEGVSTSVAGFLGETERGPEAPRLLTSYVDYKRVYGGVVENSNLAHAVKGFFDNGGSRCYVGRITQYRNPATAVLTADPNGFTPAPEGASKPHLGGQQVLEFDPDETTPTKKTVSVKHVGPDSTAKIQVDESNMDIVGDGKSAFSVESTTPTGKLDVGETADIEVKFDPGDDKLKEAELKIPHDGANDPVKIPLYGNRGVVRATAVGPGAWGGNVALVVDNASMYVEGENELFKLTIRYWSDDDAKQLAVSTNTEYEDERTPRPDVEEVYDNLSPDPASDNYYVGEVSGASNLVDLEQLAPGRPPEGVSWLSYTAATNPKPPASVDVTHYQGTATPADERTGLAAFDEVDEITIVCAPDENDIGKKLQDALVTHCSNRKDRMAILQAGEDATNPGSITPPVSSSYAAYYYPWVTVTHPETGNEVTVPPGGHVAGIYARTDAEHGVHKAPANEVLNGVLSLAVNITRDDQKTLNPKGVNCIRSFQGRGIRLWGARTTSSDPSWKYVNVRRLFMYVEESLQEGTQWVVFEPNNADLWARVRQTVSNFLTGLWEDGALMGATPAEAFYVKCDRSTMTQNDIDNGRLICEVGIAPTKPAEFVVFRISQWTAGAEGGG